MDEKKTYLAIDLKSFYASVECMERNLNPLTTNLVVADESRTEKTICLAVSPSLKSFGIPGRARLFEVIQKTDMVNAIRLTKAPSKKFTGKSYNINELNSNPSLQVDYIIAPPRMSLYMSYSTRIFRIYLKYISPEDIHVYSCDEVFMDVTKYLKLYKMTVNQLAKTILNDVLSATGITATCGIGTNLYLCKIAMDIVAKHMEPDAEGVRIAELNEKTYRELLWNHRPLTDFWRVGPGTAKRLEKMGVYTMGDLARLSEQNEDALYKAFGVNAELIIDHAWGYEPCTIDYIKKYRPSSNSLSSGQVLTRPYEYDEALLVLKEMADSLALDLVSKKLVTKQIVVTIGYEHFKDEKDALKYDGEIGIDRYKRLTLKHAHGSYNLSDYTSSSALIVDAAINIFKKIVSPMLQVRRLNIAANFLIEENSIPQKDIQLSFFTNTDEQIEINKRLEKEHSLQVAALEIKNRFGKNAILKGRDLMEGATAIERNSQVGGHKAE